jgi:hypothetical protein
MVEIMLIVFCIIAANRFNTAGEKGVSKYILGVWGTWLGSIILGSIIVGATGSAGLMYFFIIIAYVIEVIIAVSAMKAGKAYMEYKEAEKASKEKNAQEEQQQLMMNMAENMAAMQRQLSSVQTSTQNTAQSVKFPLYIGGGGGICDVCANSLNGISAYFVTNTVFYNSQKYKDYVKEYWFAKKFAAVACDDAYFADMQANDKSPGSAVCEKCIHLFE